MGEKENELVQYITKRMVTYMGTPKEVRRQLKEEKKTNDPWKSRWFGMIPFALSMWIDKRREKKRRKTQQNTKP